MHELQRKLYQWCDHIIYIISTFILGRTVSLVGGIQASNFLVVLVLEILGAKFSFAMIIINGNGNGDDDEGDDDDDDCYCVDGVVGE